MTRKPMAVGKKQRLQNGAVVDQSKVLGHLRDLGHDLEKGASAWIVPRFVGLSAMGTLFTVVVPAVVSGNLHAIVDTSASLFWARWLLPTVLSVPTVLGMYRRSRKRVDQGVGPLTAEIQRKWDRMTGKGWVRRTLGLGAGLTAGVGGTVGLLMSTLFPLAELPGGSRVLGFIGFVGMTAVWAFPMAFGIRAISMRNHRPFLRLGQEMAHLAEQETGL